MCQLYSKSIQIIRKQWKERVLVGVNVCVCVHIYKFVCVCGCEDGSWEADTVLENRPLATDLFGRWQFQSNSHPASQWPRPPNISITSSSTGLPQHVTQERGKVTHTHSCTLPHFLSSSLLLVHIPDTSVWAWICQFPCWDRLWYGGMIQGQI